MANVSSVGIGSGVLTSDLIDQLVNAERKPTEARLDIREQSVTAELSLFAKLQSAVTDMRLPARNLANPDTFNQLTVSSGSSAFSAIADKNAQQGNYTLEVSNLATSQSLTSGTFTDTDVTALGEGTLSFTVNGVVTNITIDSSNNTLEGIASAINNEAGLEASATVINNGSGYQLVINSNETGVANTLDISVTDTDGNSTDANGLSQLSYTTGAQNLTQAQAAQDAQFLFNGISISRSSNTVDDLVSGLTIELKGTNNGSPASLSVIRDDNSVVEKVKELVDKYNALRELIVENSQVDPTNTAAAGLLVGDSATRSISNQIRNLLGRTVSGLGSDSFRGLAEVGITTNRDNGTLIFSESDFRSALNKDPDAVSAIFSEQGRVTENDVEYIGKSIDTVPGSYDINITQIATRGELAASSALAASTVIDGDNDEFTISVDGVSSGSIVLSAGTYTQTELVAEIQAQLNSDVALSGAGKNVVVGVDGSGVLTFTSSEYGSSSSIEILSEDVTTSATLGFSVGAGTNGVDVAGTINGQAATGTGQILAVTGEGDAKGIQVRINGGTTGSRGEVNFIEGVGGKLVDLITGFLAADGTITAKNDRLNAELESIAESRARLNERLESLQNRLVRQFTAADILISKLNSTQDFIKGQLEALAASASGKD